MSTNRKSAAGSKPLPGKHAALGRRLIAGLDEAAVIAREPAAVRRALGDVALLKALL